MYYGVQINPLKNGKGRRGSLKERERERKRGLK